MSYVYYHTVSRNKHPYVPISILFILSMNEQGKIQVWSFTNKMSQNQAERQVKHELLQARAHLITQIMWHLSTPYF